MVNLLRSLLYRIRHPLVMRILAVSLLASSIWWGGRQTGLAFFEDRSNRIILIAIVLLIWVFYELFTRWRKLRKASALMKAVAEPGEGDVLKEKFEEAAAVLRYRKGRNGAGAENLIDLPWYVIIGPPGSGKTTALRNAGLRFPLEERFGEASLKGVGGTRDCDWWFSDKAVLLDTAGRYTTQDSNPGTDQEAWEAFVLLLKEYRNRRPINGIFVALATDTLLAGTHEERMAHAKAIRHRILELYKTLGYRFPVYILITKTDLLLGFNEFFDVLTPEERNQVWGFTRPQPAIDPKQESGIHTVFADETAMLVRRLADRVIERINGEADTKRRARILGFPEQFSRLCTALQPLLDSAFTPDLYHEPIMARGVYFTSGTQEGAPIDRMMGSMARQLGLPAMKLRPSSQERSYFIRDTLQNVAFREQDLLGLQRKNERRLIRLQQFAYIGLGIAFFIAVFVWTQTYVRQNAFAKEAENSLDAYVTAYPQDNDSQIALTAQIEDALDRLSDLQRRVAELQQSAPLGAESGLVGASGVLREVRSAYRAELDQHLSPIFRSVLERQLAGAAPQTMEVAQSFYTLDLDMDAPGTAAYLSLRYPRERLDKADARMDFERTLEFAFENSGYDDELIDRFLPDWFGQTEETGRRMPDGIEINETIFDNSIENLSSGRGARSVAETAYKLFRFTEVLSSLQENDPEERKPLKMRDSEGVRLGIFERNTNGKSLQDPIPYLYTADGARDFERQRLLPELNRAINQSDPRDGNLFSQMSVALPSSERRSIQDEYNKLYTEDYIRYWRGVLNSVVTVRVPRDARSRETFLNNLIDDNGLRGFFEWVDSQTRLADLDEADPNDKPVLYTITEAFREFHNFVAAETETPGALQKILEDIEELAIEASSLSENEEPSPEADQARKALEREARALRQDEFRSVASLLQSVAGVSKAGRATSDFDRLNERWINEHLPECRAKRFSARYPFKRGTPLNQSVGTDDLAEIFGPDGLLDRFKNDELRVSQLNGFIDVENGRWRWKDEYRRAGASDAALSQLFLGEQIGKYLFSGGAIGASFQISPSPATDPRLLNTEIRIDGELLAFSHGPISSLDARWPRSSIQITGKTSASRPFVQDTDHVWFLFKAMDTGGVRRAGQNAIEISVPLDGLKAAYKIQAYGSNNPFTTFSEWRRFDCPSSLGGP